MAADENRVAGWADSAEGPSHPPAGRIDDPRVIRAVLQFQRAVAAASETAYLALHAAGVDDPVGLLLRRWPERPIPVRAARAEARLRRGN